MSRDGVGEDGEWLDEKMEDDYEMQEDGDIGLSG